MKNLNDIYILIIVLVLIFFANKLLVKEPFSSTPTQIVYSNAETANELDRFAKINEEILILEQRPGKESVIKFKYLRAPINSYVVFYVRKEDEIETGQVTINTVLYKFETLSINIPQIMRQQNILVNDQKSVIRYYIKALDEKTLPIEKEKHEKKMAMMNRYNQCVNLKKTTQSVATAVADCKKEYKLL
jgi:hypothetical protein